MGLIYSNALKIYKQFTDSLFTDYINAGIFCLVLVRVEQR